ncbi:MAG: hypothetical protein KOO60_02365 [Gemmatimonadales bacterium]|nr:hypothetical protein [Gemmatimonadales bacterium]
MMMKTIHSLFCLLATLVLNYGSYAGELPKLVDGHSGVIHGGNLEMSRAASRDTVFLVGPWGSGAIANGQFEDPSGDPAWNGWTSTDVTQKTESAWHVDTYNVPTGVYSAWCGDGSISACSEEDPVGGYGSNYSEILSWVGTVDNPAISTVVNISATVNHNTEPGYDYSNLGYWKNEAEIAYVWTADGVGEQVAVIGSVTYQAGEYVGENYDQVRISWHVTSDGGWDDWDCLYASNGALQADNIRVTMTNDGVETSTYDDFETSGPMGTLGDNWFVDFHTGVGDYAHIRSGLKDIDPCLSNYTPVVCFIADEMMLAERGLPTQICQDWCYGPGGYIVTTTGGLAGPDAYLSGQIESPVIPWPEGDFQGVSYLFDVYRHEDLSADSPGMFYAWGIRSTDSADPADIEYAAYQDRCSGHFYGGPDWIRTGENNAADLVVPGPKYVQVQLILREHGYIWGWNGDDGYPAPYFDNVRLVCYEYFGPGMAARELDLAQDAFPADGQIHVGADMGLNDVRFDMANNISLANDLRNDPGDSIVMDIVAVRAGSVLVETDVNSSITAPRLYFTTKLNAAFGATLRMGAGAFTINSGTDGELDGVITDDGSASGYMTGYVYGARAVNNGVTSPDRWQFDLPDVDFLYPGDVLHWYVEAWDNKDGGYQNAFIPADLTGYGDFSDLLAYHSSFVVRALPTLFDGTGAQPDILFWNDFGNRGGQDEWHGAFRNLGMYPGKDYDIYYTNAPSSGVSNGLGGRAQFGQLDGYGTMVYTCGDLGWNTISNLDYENDAGDDVGLVSDWLEDGGKFLFLTGDDLVNDMWTNGGPATTAFVNSWMGVVWQENDARPLLGGDTTPMVYPVAGNSVFDVTDSWMAYGGCRVINRFDAVTVNGGEMLAQFNDGTSALSAATKFVAPNGSTVISMPYDFMFIRNPLAPSKVNQPAPLPARARVLSTLLTESGNPPNHGLESATGLPGAKFTVHAYPNPFNPSTRIEFNLPRAGHLSLKIFNVRGELVRILVDEMRSEGSSFVRWDGTSNKGRQVSSGVYYSETRIAETVRVNKMILVK